jgi:hypothetical protein
MAKATDPYDRHEIPRLCARIPERTKGRQASAKEWSGLYVRQIVGNRHQTRGFRYHPLRVAPIVVNACKLLVRAVHQMPGAAFGAMATTSREEPDPDALSNAPALYTFSKQVDLANDLVPRNSGPGDREKTFDSRSVRVADAACLNLDADLAGQRCLHRFPGKFEFARRDCVDGEIGFGRVGHIELLASWFPLVCFLQMSGTASCKIVYRRCPRRCETGARITGARNRFVQES